MEKKVTSDRAVDRAVPIEVTPSEENAALYIRWKDGHLGFLPYDFLRGACPCVLCKGRHGDVDLARVIPTAGVVLIDMEPQGSYALRFLWSDAHQTGIYSYTYLRALCRCKECAPKA